MEELTNLLQEIGAAPSDVLSKRSRAYQSRREEIDSLTEAQLVNAMVDEPTLIRRPIVTSATGHVIGAKKADLEHFAEVSAGDER